MSRSVTALAKAGGFEPALVLRQARLLRERGADVVHTHNAAGLFYGAPAARLAGVKRIIHTRHGVEPISGRPCRPCAPCRFRWTARLRLGGQH